MEQLKQLVERQAVEYYEKETQLRLENKKKEREVKVLNQEVERLNEKLEQYTMNPRYIEADDRVAAFQQVMKTYESDKKDVRGRDNLAKL